MNLERKSLLYFLLLLIFVQGSGFSAQKAPDGWKGTIETRNGVRVVKNPAEPLYGRVTLDLEQDLVIGSDQDEKTLFFMRTVTDVDGLGRIFIWDPRTYEIRIFDAKGAFARSIGKKGEGPGEFSDNIRLEFQACPDGRLAVWDNVRIQRFSPEGKFERSIVATSSGNHQFNVTARGTVIRDGMNFDKDKITELVVLTDADGKVLKQVAAFPSRRAEDAINLKPMYVLYYPELILRPWTEDAALYGYPDRYRLAAVDGSGKITLEIEQAEPPRKFLAKEKEKTINEIMGQRSRQNSRSASRDEVEKRTFFPENWPFYSNIFADERGWIFVERTKSNLEETPGTVFDVFSPDGYYLYQAATSVDECQAVKGGYLYSRKYNREKEHDQVYRYKIKNAKELFSVRGK